MFKIIIIIFWLWLNCRQTMEHQRRRCGISFHYSNLRIVDGSILRLKTFFCHTKQRKEKQRHLHFTSRLLTKLLQRKYSWNSILGKWWDPAVSIAENTLFFWASVRKKTFPSFKPDSRLPFYLKLQIFWWYGKFECLQILNFCETKWTSEV